MLELLTGLFAGLLCTISFIPQVIKIFRSKDAGGVSIITFILFSIGVFLWFLYGIMIGDYPVIITNAVIFLLALLIVFMKIRYDLRKE